MGACMHAGVLPSCWAHGHWPLYGVLVCMQSHAWGSCMCMRMLGQTHCGNCPYRACLWMTRRTSMASALVVRCWCLACCIASLQGSRCLQPQQRCAPTMGFCVLSGEGSTPSLFAPPPASPHLGCCWVPVAPGQELQKAETPCPTGFVAVPAACRPESARLSARQARSFPARGTSAAPRRRGAQPRTVWHAQLEWFRDAATGKAKRSPLGPMTYHDLLTQHFGIRLMAGMVSVDNNSESKPGGRYRWARNARHADTLLASGPTRAS